MKQNFFKQKEDPRSELFDLIKNGSENAFEELFKKTGNDCFDFVNENDETLLISACKEGRDDIAKLLLKINLPSATTSAFGMSFFNPYITRKDSKGKSAVFYAYQNALFEIIPTIIDHCSSHSINSDDLEGDIDLHRNLKEYVEEGKKEIEHKDNKDFEKIITKAVVRLNPNSENITKEMRESAIIAIESSLEDIHTTFCDLGYGGLTPSISNFVSPLMSPLASKKREEMPNVPELQEQKIESDAPRTSPQVEYFSSLINCLCRPFQRNSSRVVVGGNDRS